MLKTACQQQHENNNTVLFICKFYHVNTNTFFTTLQFRRACDIMVILVHFKQSIILIIASTIII